jgi:hypothetical protein
MASLSNFRRANTEAQQQGFKADKYKIQQHMYPSDLMAQGSNYTANQYGGNYVIFYVNVAEDSKLLNSQYGTAQEITDDKSFTRDRGPLLAENLSKTGLVAGAVTGSALKGAVAGGFAFGKAITGAAVGAAPGAIGLGAAASLAASTTRAQKRLKTAIALHIPNQLNIRYGVQYGEEDTATAMMAPILGSAALKALDQKNTANLTGPAAAAVGNLGLTSGPNAGAVSAATGLAANPRKEQVFKGVDFRTFQFEYQFFPRGPTESENVMNIINEFKLHMHPEFKDSNKFLYIYPSEFDISYYTNGRENLHLHRHTSCVLTELNVNYTPNGTFATFENGMPTQINVTLSFRELSLMDKDKIMEGL